MPTINYRAMMSDRTGRSEDYSIPISLTKAEMTALLQNNQSASKAILLRAVEQAQKVFFQSHWQCCVCNAKASRSINTPAFHPAGNPPVILDYTPFPICFSSRCNHEATRQANQLTSELSGFSPQLRDKELKVCKNCGAVEQASADKMLRCAGCKAMWYCGRNCQIAHWKKEHKYNCERLDKQT